MIKVNAWVHGEGVVVKVLGDCSGWSHEGRKPCSAVHQTCTVATYDLERLGVQRAVVDGLRTALDQDPVLISRMWC